MLKAGDVARKSFGVRQQEMRKQNRLRVLHVGHARHGHVDVGFGLLQESVKQ